MVQEENSRRDELQDDIELEEEELEEEYFVRDHAGWSRVEVRPMARRIF